MKKRVVGFITIITIVVGFMLALSTFSKGYSQYVDGIIWYYSVQNGNAVNVYTNSNPSGTVKIPETLGGYTVTSIGRASGSSSSNMFTSSRPYSTNVREVIIPDTVKSIRNYAFYWCDVETIILSEGLETIGNNAFWNCDEITTIEIPSTVKSIGNSAFENCDNLETIILNEGLETIGDSAFAGNYSILNQNDNLKLPDSLISVGNSAFSSYQIQSIEFGSNIQSIGTNIAKGVTDVYINTERENVTYTTISESNPYIHLKGCTHILSFENVEGLDIINQETGEKIVGNVVVPCKSNFSYYINQTNEKLNIDNYKMLKYEIKYDEKTSETLSIKNKEIVTLENIQREYNNVIQFIPTHMDLVTRMYINKVNSAPVEDREPVIQIQGGKVGYLHTKQNYEIKKGDIVEFFIRIYNEGQEDGNLEKVTAYLSDGIEFDINSVTNRNYGWNINEETGELSTAYLKGKTINKYFGGTDISYEEILLVCTVTKDVDKEDARIVTACSITESAMVDYDSTFEGLNTTNLDNYMKEESENSNSQTYVKSSDDSIDYESFILKAEKEVEYKLKINKIDSETSELLKGAKFNLLNREGEIIDQAQTSQNGQIEFNIITLEEGSHIFYIQEIEEPIGYKNNISYKLKIMIEKTNGENGEEIINTACDIDDIKVDLSEVDKIEITSIEELKNIESNKAYILANDIDLGETNWTPLEKVTNCVIDGNGYKITNLKIESTNESEKVYGLFKEFDGAIINLNLENVKIQITDVEDSRVTALEEENTNLTAELETEITDERKSEIEERQKQIEQELYAIEKENAIGSLIGIAGNIYIENCKVTGDINSENSNVGGFIGQNKADTLAVIRNSTNEAKVEGKSNIGGFLGFTSGAVNIIDSSNKGEISSSSYNAGGFIGRSDYTEYEWTKTYIQSSNKQIEVVIDNKSVDNYYKLELKTVDANTLQILPNAKYEIYNKDKEKIAEEKLTLVDGKISIENIKIKNLSSDVYYLKQVETEQGYKILTSDYIRVKIIKTWDSEERKYVVGVEGKIITQAEMLEDSINETYESSNTGEIYGNTLNNNINWKTGKIGIFKSTNDGKITANANAGGTIGRTDAYIVEEHVQNNGIITSNSNHAGGLIAEIIDGLNTEVEIYNCTNNSIAEINLLAEEGSYGAGGIIGTTGANTKVEKTQNYSAVYGKGAMVGGIIGDANTSNVEIINSSNAGKIVSTGGVNAGIAGGILGRSSGTPGGTTKGEDLIENSSTKIENNTNTGNIESTSHAGGIAGFITTRNILIDSCTNEQNQIIAESADIGGILGYIDAKNIEVKNNKTNGAQIRELSKSSYNVSGLGGIIGHIFFNTNNHLNDNEENSIKVQILNNQSTNNEINFSLSCAGGIVGEITNYSGVNAGNIDVYIVNNNIDSVNITHNLKEYAGYSEIGGVVGGVYLYGGRNFYVNKCQINKFNVQQIIEEGCSGLGNSSIGGAIGFIGARIETIEFNDCYVIDTVLHRVNTTGDLSFLGWSNNCHNIGGLIGSSMTSNEENFNVFNIEVKNININAISGDTGGIFGNSIYAKNLHFENCNVIGGNIKHIFEITLPSNSFYSGGSCTGGLIGALGTGDNSFTATNCHVKDLTIDSSAKNIGGFIAENLGTGSVENCSVDNIDIYSKNSGFSSNTTGFVATLMRTTTFKDISVTNVNIEARSQLIAGFYGWAVQSARSKS